MPSLRDQLQPTVDHAIRLHQAGQVAEAEQIYRRVLQQDPGNPDALHLLGLIAHHTGNYGPAAELMKRAIGSAPNVALYHVNLAKVYRACGRFDEAAASARRGTQLSPRFVEAHVELSACLRAAHHRDEAAAAAREAVKWGPNHPEALSSLASAMSDQNRLDEAIKLYESALRVRSGWPEAIGNLGEALRKAGRLDEAEKYLRAAIRAAPQIGETHFSLAVALLARGQYDEGWREYEWRWKQIGVHMRPFAQPAWSGLPLRGETIFLFSEQGLGDAIQFVRYAPLLIERGAGRVIVECDPSLLTLLKTVPGVFDVVATNTSPPSFDLHCPLASLPYRCGTTVETIPNRVPYLFADPQRTARWREQLRLTRYLINVGLVWAGRPHPNPNRSCRLADLAPLASIPNVRFVSLQLNRREEASQGFAGAKVEDPTADIHDFADTAALMSALDLILSIDTSAAHLAGALARPVWTVHPHVTDWRWFIDRDDSPWYPTMRVFRQTKPGDWNGVFARVADALRMEAGG